MIKMEEAANAALNECVGLGQTQVSWVVPPCPNTRSAASYEVGLYVDVGCWLLGLLMGMG